jgi:hypothetical protein
MRVSREISRNISRKFEKFVLKSYVCGHPSHMHKKSIQFCSLFLCYCGQLIYFDTGWEPSPGSGLGKIGKIGKIPEINKEKH